MSALNGGPQCSDCVPEVIVVFVDDFVRAFVPKFEAIRGREVKDRKFSRVIHAGHYPIHYCVLQEISELRFAHFAPANLSVLNILLNESLALRAPSEEVGFAE